MSDERRGRPKIIVFGFMFWYPLAGVTYQFLHYLLGLRQLGYDVHYVEDSGSWVYDPRIDATSADDGHNVGLIAPVLERHGFARRWAFRGCYPEGRLHGMDETALASLYQEAVAFLNVTGAQALKDEHLAVPHRLYVETDPFAVQVRAAQGHAETLAALAGHTALFTFGENIGRPGCGIPAERFAWLPTRQPVALDLWPVSPGEPATGFRTLTTWRNTTKDVTVAGETYYWTKHREFLKVIDLPCRVPAPFTLATNADGEGRALLRRHGWGVEDAIAHSLTLDGYRAFVGGSYGEFTVARDQYVRPWTGWFSDRSACFLAAGRPVITQDTGFSEMLPTGRGLFAFSTVDDVGAAVEAIASDYAGHAHAAREIAAEYFAGDRVLASLLERAGL